MDDNSNNKSPNEKAGESRSAHYRKKKSEWLLKKQTISTRCPCEYHKAAAASYCKKHPPWTESISEGASCVQDDIRHAGPSTGIRRFEGKCSCEYHKAAAVSSCNEHPPWTESISDGDSSVQDDIRHAGPSNGIRCFEGICPCEYHKAAVASYFESPSSTGRKNYSTGSAEGENVCPVINVAPLSQVTEKSQQSTEDNSHTSDSSSSSDEESPRSQPRSHYSKSSCSKKSRQAREVESCSFGSESSDERESQSSERRDRNISNSALSDDGGFSPPSDDEGSRSSGLDSSNDREAQSSKNRDYNPPGTGPPSGGGSSSSDEDGASSSTEKSQQSIADNSYTSGSALSSDEESPRSQSRSHYSKSSCNEKSRQAREVESCSFGSESSDERESQPSERRDRNFSNSALSDDGGFSPPSDDEGSRSSGLDSSNDTESQSSEKRDYNPAGTGPPSGGGSSSSDEGGESSSSDDVGGSSSSGEDEDSTSPDEDGSSSDEDGNSSSSDEDEDSSSSDCGMELRLKESLNVPVQIRRGRTAREILILILGHAIRFHDTYESTLSTCRNMNTSLSPPVLPTSKPQLWKCINKNPNDLLLHAYCNSCKMYLKKLKDLRDDEVCPGCGTTLKKKKTKYFASLSLRKQFEHFFNIPGMSDILSYQHTRQKEDERNIEDVMDGNLYKDLRAEGKIGENDFVYAFNTDGFDTGESADTSVWPLFVRFYGLPPPLRQKHMFLAGVWADDTEPDMDTFFKPFVAQANKLATRGIKWKSDGENEITSRLIPLLSSADSKARCKFCGLSQFNAFFGCTRCYYEGIFSAGSMRYPIPPFLHIVVPPEPRTHESTIADMRLALESGVPVKGVTGPAEIINLKAYDVIRGQGIDALHCIWLGNVKAHTKLLWNSVGQDYYISAQSKAIVNRRILSIRTPDSVSRKQRPITNKGKWKGTQWRNFLLYFFPCLKGCLPQKYIDHFALLSYGTFLLSQESISPDDYETACRVLDEYVELYHQYFTVDHMNYNVHLLPHVAESSGDLGPTWAFNTVGFESWNHLLNKTITSPKGIIQQIVTRFHLRQMVTSSIHDVTLSPEVRQELEGTLFQRALKTARRVGTHIYVVGPPKRRDCTPEEEALLLAEGYNVDGQVSEYQRIIVPCGEVHCDGYREEESKSDNSKFVTKDNCCLTLVSVLVFGDDEQVCVLFGKKYTVLSNLRNAPHVAIVLLEDESLCLILPTEVKSLAITYSALGDLYAVSVPNRKEID